MTTAPSFNSLKRTFTRSGYEIRYFNRHKLEQLALDAPADVKRHLDSNIMGLIMPDQEIIGIAADLNPEEKVTTLIHELIHLHDETMDEESVEAATFDLENGLTPAN